MISFGDKCIFDSAIFAMFRKVTRENYLSFISYNQNNRLEYPSTWIVQRSLIGTCCIHWICRAELPTLVRLKDRFCQLSDFKKVPVERNLCNCAVQQKLIIFTTINTLFIVTIQVLIHFKQQLFSVRAKPI